MSARGGFTWRIYRRRWLPLFVELMASLCIPTPTGSPLLTERCQPTLFPLLQLHYQKYIFFSSAFCLMFLLPLSSIVDEKLLKTHINKPPWTHTTLLPQTLTKKLQMWIHPPLKTVPNKCTISVSLIVYSEQLLEDKTMYQARPVVPHLSTRCPQSFLPFTCCCSSLLTCPWYLDTDSLLRQSPCNSTAEEVLVVTEKLLEDLHVFGGHSRCSGTLKCSSRWL